MLGLVQFNIHPGSSCGKITQQESIRYIAQGINQVDRVVVISFQIERAQQRIADPVNFRPDPANQNFINQIRIQILRLTKVGTICKIL